MTATIHQRHDDKIYFQEIDDLKLRASLIAFADSIDESSRTEIYNFYTDPFLLTEYQNLRNSGVYDKGDPSKSMRKTVEYPSMAVRDFVYKSMEALYGDDWQKNKTKYHKALRHELMAPWVVVGKI